LSSHKQLATAIPAWWSTSSLSAATTQSSPLGQRRRNILGERKRARDCLSDQAERIVKNHALSCKQAT